MQLKDLGNLSNVLKSLNSSNNISEYFNSLNLSMQKCVLSSGKLTEAQLLNINQNTVWKLGIDGTNVSLSGLSQKELESALSTTTLSASQTTATATTTGLGSALKGLWATMLANPLILVATAVTAGITVWNIYKQSVEEMRQATAEAASVFNDTSSSIQDYADKYKALHDELTKATTTEERQKQIKDDLLSLQKELNDKYGDEYDKVNLVTDAYKDQTEAILAMNQASAKNYLLENREGIDSATSKMEQQRTYSLGSTGYMSNDYAQQMYDIVSQYTDQGINLEQFNAGSETGYKITFTGDAEQADKVIHDLANQVQDLQENFKDNNFVESFLDNSANALKENNEVLDKYQEIYDSSLMAQIASDDKLSEGYTKAKTAVDQYNNAVASGDDSKIEEARSNLNDVKNTIDLTSDDWKRYGGIMNNVFDQASTGLYDFRDDIELNQDGIKDLTSNLKGLSKEELLAMADDGQVDNFDKLVEAGKKYELSAEDVITVLERLKIVQGDVAKSGVEAFTPLSKQDLITNINSLSTGFESLDKIMNSIKDKDNLFDYALLDDKGFKETFGGLEDEYTKFVETISSAPKDLKSTQSAFNDLTTAWIDDSGVLDGLTEDNSSLATAMLQNMGVANAAEVVASRLAITQEHLAAQKAYTAEMSTALANATADEIPNIIEEGTQSDIAKVALAGLVLEKEYFNGNALDTSGDIENILSLVGVIGTANTALKALNTLKAGGNVGYGLGGKEGYDAIVAAAQKEVDEAIKAASEYKGKGNTTNVDYSGGTKTNKASSSKSKEETKKDIDWIERELQLLNNKRDELLNKASGDSIDYLGLTNEEFARAKELFSGNVSQMSDEVNELFAIADKAGISIGQLSSLIANGMPGASKENYLAQVLEIDKNLLDEYNQSVAQYQSEYDKAASKISPQYKAKIELGDMSVDTLSGDELDNVQSAMDAYDKLKDVQSSQAEMQSKYLDDIKAKYENIAAAIKTENEQIENSNSLIEAQMDYLQSSGEIVGSSYYKRLINNTDSQISNTKDSITNLKKEMKELLANGYSKNSEEYLDLKGEINEAEVSIYSLEKTQEEYNQTLEQMPIDNLSTLISMYGDVTDTIQNWGAIQTATGEKLNGDYYQTLISNGSKVINQYQKQAKLIKEVMDEYDAGSDRWNELYSQLQSINSEMSSMVVNLAQWNEELLNMPLESIESYTSNLHQVIDGLSSVKSEYDTVVSAVTGAIKEQIELLQEEQETAEDAAQAQIDALQEKLDLLEKQNEKLKLQTTLEQALFDLERATTQKTQAVIREGEVVYESNVDDVRSAQQAIVDAQYEIKKYDLQSQIDDAHDALDDLNDSYQDQIDALQTISDKWTQISDKITQAQNEATATSILGDGWVTKVLTGNDSAIYEAFTSLYKTNAEQLQQYQEQADTINNIYALLEDYIASYKDGTITYEQAMSGINGLLSQMNDSMSAMDNLQNIFDYLGTTNGVNTDADSVLKGIQNGLSITADELAKSLEQYNKNSGMISEYTSSWQQLTDNVRDMLDVLEDVRDNLRDGYDRDDDDDEKGDDSGAPFGEDNSGYVDSGPGVKQKNDDPIWDLIDDKKVTSRKDGITRGLVGSSSTSDKEAKMKLLGLKKIDPDEIPAILHMNEAVYNPEQQKVLLDNFAAAYSFKPNAVDYSSMLSGVTVRESTPKQEFNFNGGIHIQECNDGDQLAKEILNGGLTRAVIQSLGRR